MMMIVLETDMTRVIIELATKTGVGAKINTKTGTEMTVMTNTEIGLEKDTACLRKIKMTSQRLNKSTKSYDS